MKLVKWETEAMVVMAVTAIAVLKVVPVELEVTADKDIAAETEETAEPVVPVMMLGAVEPAEKAEMEVMVFIKAAQVVAEETVGVEQPVVTAEMEVMVLPAESVETAATVVMAMMIRVFPADAIMAETVETAEKEV